MKTLCSALLTMVTMMTVSAQSPSVEYTLGMSRPWTHLFEVEVLFRNLPAGESRIDLSLPVWRTGRYIVFDFAGGVVEFSADNGSDKPLQWEKIDKSTWRIQKKATRTVRARYAVYANEFDLRTRGLNDEHGFVDGTSVFMYADQYRSLPVTLTVIPYGDWHVTTGLQEIHGEPPFRYTAPHYDYLVDCPLEIGNQNDVEFSVEGKKHVLSVFGPVTWETDSVLNTITRIIRMNKEFWGDLPYDRYVFLFRAMPGSSGATEHMNSAVMGIDPFGFKKPGGYDGLVGLVSHEFFHTWNVKRLRPKSMDPYDWTSENYSKELWIAEGGTSYMHGVLLARNGFRTPEKYVDGIAAAVASDRTRPGNEAQSISECSFDAWVKFWRSTEQRFNFESDIYSKGSHLCMLLDLEIRHLSGNKHSFDDLLKTMYNRFPLGGGGYTVKDFQKVAEELAGSSLSGFFNDFVYGTAQLPWERSLLYAGLVLEPIDTTDNRWLGINTRDNGHSALVTDVIRGSSAYDSGLNSGDDIVALNGYRVNGRDLERRLTDFSYGDTVTLTVFRNNRIRDFGVTVSRQQNASYTVSRIEEPTPLQRSIFESWLNTHWGEEAQDAHSSTDEQ
ncbi:MAG: PDZ domain-containing protein [Ignavibacteria bacterium]|nr:PDZ domain-containing protein [Ignavibacteria bacterium]